jgi:very-short-patch-repair endonuclease
VSRRPQGVLVHRRRRLHADDVTEHECIPVTAPICTLIDIAAQLEPDLVEAAINEADRLGLTDPERLRRALDECGRRPGVKVLREILDRRTFTLTRSELERFFRQLAHEIGFSKPQTNAWVNGLLVDFFWRELGLVIETDGLRYHRTPAQQAKDRIRDQAHAAVGMTPLRFTHAQVKFEPDYVKTVVTRVARRLFAERRSLSG